MTHHRHEQDYSNFLPEHLKDVFNAFLSGGVMTEGQRWLLPEALLIVTHKKFSDLLTRNSATKISEKESE